MKLPHSLFWAGSSLEFIFTGETLHLGFTADFTHLEPWISAELTVRPCCACPWSGEAAAFACSGA